MTQDDVRTFLQCPMPPHVRRHDGMRVTICRRFIVAVREVSTPQAADDRPAAITVMGGETFHVQVPFVEVERWFRAAERDGGPK